MIIECTDWFSGLLNWNSSTWTDEEGDTCISTATVAVHTSLGSEVEGNGLDTWQTGVLCVCMC